MKLGTSIKTVSGLCFIVLFLTGCQGVVPVKIKPLKQPEQKAEGTLLVGDLARNVRKEAPNLIGYHTFTVLGLRTVPIRPASPPGMQDAMTEHIKKALRTTGYEVKVVPPGIKQNVPILRGEIHKFWFSSYWWFWPVTMVGGDIKLQLILESPEGKRLWEKECKGGGFMVLPSFANVDFLVRDAATKICNQVVESISSDEFHQVWYTSILPVKDYGSRVKDIDEPKEPIIPDRKIIGYHVDTSRKGPDGKFLRVPVYEDEKK